MRTEAHFSRRGGAADSVLVAAKMRGVDVALKLDKIESAGKTQAAMIAKLEQAGDPVHILGREGSHCLGPDVAQ
jgi:hypothetical protein